MYYFKAYITKYALTRGIIVSEKACRQDDMGNIRAELSPCEWEDFKRGEWYEDPEMAAKKATQMRDLEVSRLETKLDGLRALSFDGGSVDEDDALRRRRGDAKTIVLILQDAGNEVREVRVRGDECDFDGCDVEVVLAEVNDLPIRGIEEQALKFVGMAPCSGLGEACVAIRFAGKRQE